MGWLGRSCTPIHGELPELTPRMLLQQTVYQVVLLVQRNELKGRLALRGSHSPISGSSGGHLSRHGDAASNAAEARNTIGSSRWRPTICRPTGKPSAVHPAGTVAAGCPVRFSGYVNAEELRRTHVAPVDFLRPLHVNRKRRDRERRRQQDFISRHELRHL